MFIVLQVLALVVIVARTNWFDPHWRHSLTNNLIFWAITIAASAIAGGLYWWFSRPVDLNALVFACEVEKLPRPLGYENRIRKFVLNPVNLRSAEGESHLTETWASGDVVPSEPAPDAYRCQVKNAGDAELVNAAIRFAVVFKETIRDKEGAITRSGDTTESFAPTLHLEGSLAPAVPFVFWIVNESDLYVNAKAREDAFAQRVFERTGRTLPLRQTGAPVLTLPPLGVAFLKP